VPPRERLGLRALLFFLDNLESLVQDSNEHLQQDEIGEKEPSAEEDGCNPDLVMHGGQSCAENVGPVFGREDDVNGQKCIVDLIERVLNRVAIDFCRNLSAQELDGLKARVSDIGDRCFWESTRNLR
jgi:hypothetical protein